ncbi:MAG: hypothetical protein II382_06895 [Oscillospiraceae bacterium]|nr:hypothetical protein [Oscillospiraceae bacterium]MBQ2143764.1 hypothetical protein [Oscillospiraceae bacterium]MBQ2328901.1 hypothetical protein [Oscillospiraceae bacterium]MBQ4302409.1 hypothetical protein [Oscillospiraceae bacterium]MBQ6031332.1 hypothetical protein [Oscillospiraceae bacterium]
MGDTLKYLLYVLPVIGVVALVFYLIIRKQNRKTDAFKNALTKEQKDRLINTKPVRADASRGGFILEALVVELRDKGAKTFVRLMWFNALIQNNSFLDMMTANVNVSTEEAKRRDLKVGDFVRFWFNPQQQKWDIMF